MREMESGSPTAVPVSTQDTRTLGSMGFLTSVHPDPAPIHPSASVKSEVPRGYSGIGEGGPQGLLILQCSGCHPGRRHRTQRPENVLRHRNAAVARQEFMGNGEMVTVRDIWKSTHGTPPGERDVQAAGVRSRHRSRAPPAL